MGRAKRIRDGLPQILTQENGFSTEVDKMSLQTKKYRKHLTENKFYSILQEELRKKDLSITADVLFLKDVPLEERRKEAEKPLYLTRYE